MQTFCRAALYKLHVTGLSSSLTVGLIQLGKKNWFAAGGVIYLGSQTTNMALAADMQVTQCSL